VTCLEAFGRTLAGIAPWLALGPDETPEGVLRARYIDLSGKALVHATDPKSPDFMNFTKGGQPLVDAAFLSLALLRAPDQLWKPLDASQRANVVNALKSTRPIKPGENNWLLFSALVEAALWQLPIVLGRAKRYAEVQERLISPEGTFPVIGRSSAYRFGAFQTLSLVALRRELPESVAPAAVRCGLGAVVRRMTEAPGTFDKDGWLRVGIAGYQPAVREGYISTGSLYLCLTGLLHLGLPAEDPFWNSPAKDWTQKRLWAGENVPSDHALK
jgi:hypothetical protein